MGKTVHVFSTLATDQRYVNYDTNPEGIPLPISDIFIKGGAGVANDRLITPYGVATEVPEEQVAELEKNPVFQKHKKAGFIVIRGSKADPDKVATDMNARDPSKPLTPADYLDKQVDAVVAAGKEVLNKKDAE
jgi:hypothetical protein